MPRPDRAHVPRPRAGDDDQYVWLVTFSDLVLQLFGFVILGVVALRAARPSPPPGTLAAAVAAAVADAPAPAADLEVPAPGVPDPAAEHATSPSAIDAAEVRAAVALVDEAARRADAPVEPAVEASEPVPPAPAAGPSASARPSEPPPVTPRGARPLDAQLAALVAAHPADEGLRVTVQDATVVFTLDDGIAFTSGSADLLPGATPILGEIRRLAASLPAFTVEVAGHTDDVPIRTPAFPSNLELSLARAARVAREIAGADPALRARTVARGWGEVRPLASNADPAGRARNRRVEVRLVPSDPG
jgi:flagellar motor protein MotB